MPIGPGTRVGGLLGEGGMGKVWRARHTAHEQGSSTAI
jgi:hypothetical protein